MARSKQTKTFSYRFAYPDGSAEQAALGVADWWEGFEWVTGPVVVFWKAVEIGELQVWAVSEAEGQGVIGHALAHMGISPEAGEWRSAVVTNPRFGKTATVRASCASARSGSSGPAHTVYLETNQSTTA